MRPNEKEKWDLLISWPMSQMETNQTSLFSTSLNGDFQVPEKVHLHNYKWHVCIIYISLHFPSLTVLSSFLDTLDLRYENSRRGKPKRLPMNRQILTEPKAGPPPPGAAPWTVKES